MLSYLYNIYIYIMHAMIWYHSASTLSNHSLMFHFLVCTSSLKWIGWLDDGMAYKKSNLPMLSIPSKERENISHQTGSVGKIIIFKHVGGWEGWHVIRWPFPGGFLSQQVAIYFCDFVCVHDVWAIYNIRIFPGRVVTPNLGLVRESCQNGRKK